MEEAGRDCDAKENLFAPICRAVIDYYEAARPPFSFEDLVLITAALIKKESCFNPYAMSSKGAVGLMQVHFPYWKSRFPELELSDLYDPYFNVGFALWILDVEWRRTGQLAKALLQYGGFRAGPRGRAYVRSVLRGIYLLQKCLKEGRS